MFINDEAQKQVLPIVAKATVAPPTEVQQRASSLLQLNPGQQVKAEIIANLPNNRYLARIAGEMFKLEIPLNVQPGETLEMTYVSSEPRISFQLLRPESGSSVKLSSMGKWLSDVVMEERSLPASNEPLLENPAQGSALLAQRLKAALTQGGLFYEAHLARWAAGELPLAELLKEPQGRLSRLVAGDDPQDGGKADAAAEFADARTLPLIKEQLLLLNGGGVMWKGTAWPGQEMELAVTRREAEAGEPEIEAALSLALPHLGGVDAKLRFGPEGFFIDFVCERGGTSDLLREGAGELRQSLAASGIPLTRMVSKDAEAVE